MEPSNEILLVHLEHIRHRVDDTHEDVKKLIAQGGNHEGRIVLLEDRPEPTEPSKYGKIMSVIGGFLGGILSGIAGARLK